MILSPIEIFFVTSFFLPSLSFSVLRTVSLIARLAASLRMLLAFLYPDKADLITQLLSISTMKLLLLGSTLSVKNPSSTACTSVSPLVGSIPIVNASLTGPGSLTEASPRNPEVGPKPNLSLSDSNLLIALRYGTTYTKHSPSLSV